MQKPKLSIDDQVKHLKDKGVKFDLISEDDAKEYLRNNNNYFKLAAYRKNYQKHTGGSHAGEYINLDFAYLVDTAVIDMHLRYQIIHLALDIEHCTKLQILNSIDAHAEDDYQIVDDYIASLSQGQQLIFNGEIVRNRNSIYCGDLLTKYFPGMPVWVFLELIPFGRVIDFYKFCSIRFADKDMQKRYYLLLSCKEIRNASAHSSCIINDLQTGTSKYPTSYLVTKALAAIPGMTPSFRKSRMSNARIQQLVTLLYVHRTFVASNGVKRSEAQSLRKLRDRILKNKHYYKGNPLLQSSYNFITLVIDSWFPSV